ncbi:NACHT domain-containing protein [Actinosynnema sp. CS-041913]|uniref:NACHT domain-containing protein n=1 Tax=Actinosynnema sp. CS-041913 TaxID=3239917 RepID=UPI003D93E597
MAQEEWTPAANHIGGHVYGPAVQAGHIHGDVHINHVAGDVQAVPAEAPTHHPPPEGWDTRPELPPEIRFLLRAQVQAARELPYRLPGARRPSLATVHVRQDLGSGHEEPSDQNRPTPMLDSRRRLVDPPGTPVARPAVRPPSRTVRAALDGDDHLLVTGGPGQGKSTLSLRLAADIAARWTASDGGIPLTEPVVPVRLAARELATRLDLPFAQALADAVRVEYGSLLRFAVDARTLGERVVGCRWLLLVDGLDEVADATRRDRLVAVLAAWASDESPYRVMLTTRPIEGAALAPLQRVGAARYELQPFDEEALRRFAENWFDDGGDSAYRFVRQVREAHLDELVRVPLLATIAAIIFEQHDDRPLPDNRYELYEAYLKYLRSGRPTTRGPFDHCCDALLEHLGRIRLEADTSLVAAAQAWAQHHLADLAGDWREELTTFLAAVGPLTRHGDDLRFLHHSFAEHLAATARARLLPDRFDPDHTDFAHLLHAARPEERGRHARMVLFHHTRLHPAEADRLVRWSHEGDAELHLLAARLLASRVPAGEEVVTAFLATVRAWAMTTQHPGGEILSQAGRAAHHPGLAAWLADLMRDAGAPWESRVEAAAALATRLRGPETAEAVAKLRAVVDDPDIPAKHRLAAAEALSECGGSEREASERGLRTVLADPMATALNHRNAAVVLAGFGPDARAHAVDRLDRLLRDPQTPDAHLIEAATALVEIGVEFHERGADVFRTVLRTRTSPGRGVREAAIGLASLGPQQSADAVAALTALVTDPRVDFTDRVHAAEALAELGPQHRVAAGRHLLALSAEPSAGPGDRRDIGVALARLGPDFRSSAVRLLRAVLTYPATNPNNLLWTARALIDLGPDQHDEAARVLQEVAADPLAGVYDRATSWARLAGLGEPHRTPAVAALRAALADRDAHPSLRAQAAGALARLGPEFHAEVAGHLLAIVSGQPDPDVHPFAWRILGSLGSEFRRRASTALLDLAATDEQDGWSSQGLGVLFFASDTDDPAQAAEVLTAVLRDPARKTRTRLAAARSLLDLGRHLAAVDGAVALLRSGLVPLSGLWSWVPGFADVAAGPRGELADALKAAACHPAASENAVCQVARALDALEHHGDPDIVAALREIVADESAEALVRGDAAVALARAASDRVPDAVAVVLRIHDRGQAAVWESQVRQLAALGGDVAQALRRLVSDRDATRAVRAASAAVLADLRPEFADEATRELRSQISDEFLHASVRVNVMRHLAAADSSARHDAVAYHRALLDDETEMVSHRITAAFCLARLDRSAGPVALSALRRFGFDQTLTAEERALSVVWAYLLTPTPTAEAARLVVAVVGDPSSGSQVRHQSAAHLSGKARPELDRLLLADHSAPIRHRVPGTDPLGHQRLPAETERVIRDVLAGPETRPAERVAAAVELGRLSARFVAEAASLLAASGRLDAARELAKLGPAWRRRVVAEARGVFGDETRSWRARHRAAGFLCEITADPPDAVPDHLRRVARDERVAEVVRLDALFALRRTDGLDAVRAIRDDERASPAIRWTAAVRLRDYSSEDRAAGARVLHAIATDPLCRPVLRRHAAGDLMGSGTRGSELGVAVLQAIIADDTLALPNRVRAAEVLGLTRPDLRAGMLRFLRGLRTDNPLHRRTVLAAIGLLEPEEGARALRELAQDRTHGPVARLRCAETMAELRRDYREAAAIVAREIAHDVTTPHHVRATAARNLARWSELCRAEARELLEALRG